MVCCDAQHEHVILRELDQRAVAAAVDDLLVERRLHDGALLSNTAGSPVRGKLASVLSGSFSSFATVASWLYASNARSASLFARS